MPGKLLLVYVPDDSATVIVPKEIMKAWTCAGPPDPFTAFTMIHAFVMDDLRNQLHQVKMADKQMRGPRSGNTYRRINEDAPRVYGDLYYADVWRNWHNLDHSKAYTPQLMADGFQIDLAEPGGLHAVNLMSKLALLPMYVHDDYEALFYENTGPLTVDDIHPLWELFNLNSGKEKPFSRVYDDYVKSKSP
jgi:hypothetical protein